MTEPKRILVVEDDPAIAQLLQLMLEDEGYTVSATRDPSELTEAAVPLPDLVLLDLRLSGANGGEVCRRLKGQDRTGGVPVVLVSADPHAATVAGECGADAVLAKPFDLDDALALVWRLLDGEG